VGGGGAGKVLPFGSALVRAVPPSPDGRYPYRTCGIYIYIYIYHNDNP
jgi:hypothetical protein